MAAEMSVMTSPRASAGSGVAAGAASVRRRRRGLGLGRCGRLGGGCSAGRRARRRLRRLGRRRRRRGRGLRGGGLGRSGRCGLGRGGARARPAAASARRLAARPRRAPLRGAAISSALDALLAGLDPGGDRLDDQRARADRVVVAGDHVVGLVRIAVRVDERDHRQAEPPRLAHRELLLAQVDDEDRVGLAAHVGDAAEVRLELLELGRHRDALLRGQQVELRLLRQRAQLVQPLDAVGDRAPVREQAAEPAVVDVRHADAARPRSRRRPAPASSCRRTAPCRRAAAMFCAKA